MRQRGLRAASIATLLATTAGVFSGVGAAGAAGGSRPALVWVVGAPVCAHSAARARSLTGVTVSSLGLTGRPLSVAWTSDRQWAFVSMDAANSAALAVLHRGATGLTQVRTTGISGPWGLDGLALTPDGRYLLGGAIRGVVVFDVARLESGARNVVLGHLSAPGPFHPGFHIALSRDGRYAFLATTQSGGIEVFDLQSARRHQFRTSGFVGTVPAGESLIGMTLSNDGRVLYAADEARNALAIVDVARAETKPGRALVRTVAAGCGPILSSLSSDGQTLWVTALSSNALIAFSTRKLLHDPHHAITAVAHVGHGPVGVASVDHGRRLLVADTGYNGGSLGSGSLAVIDPAALLAHQPYLRGYIPIHGTPREITEDPTTDTAFVTSYRASELEIVPTSTLP